MGAIFQLYRPHSLKDALNFLSKNAPDVKPLAGGTELLILIRDKKIDVPRYLLDLSPLKPDLSYVKVENDKVRVGAMTTLYEISKSILHTDVRFAGFVDVWKKFGTMAVRFNATIGGNIVTATQYSDYIPVLLTYDAIVKTISIRGEREFELEKFIIDVRKTLLNPDEIVKEVVFTIPPSKSSSSFMKFDRRNQLIAGIVTGAFYLTLENNLIKDIRVAYDMVKEKKIPARAKEVEAYLKGREFNEEVLEKASHEVLPKIMHRVSDWWTTAEYRLEMSKVILKRGLLKAKERIERGCYE